MEHMQVKRYRVTKFNKRNGEWKPMRPKIITASENTIIEAHASRDGREYGRLWKLELVDLDAEAGR